MAIVAQWQSTGGHNYQSWVQFPAIASFMFSLFMIMVVVCLSLNYACHVICDPLVYSDDDVPEGVISENGVDYQILVYKKCSHSINSH